MSLKHNSLFAVSVILIGAACRIQSADSTKELVDEFGGFARFEKTAPLPDRTNAVATVLPLQLGRGDRIAFIGNTLFDRDIDFGFFESMLHQRFPNNELVVRNLSWSADEVDLRPRPENFASLEQQLTIEKVDVIFAAFGFNESFAGTSGLPNFRRKLAAFINDLRTSAFNGRSGPRIVLVSPIANENVDGVRAADLNNENLRAYVDIMKLVAEEQRIGFADVFGGTEIAMRSPESDMTFNGVHLLEAGYEVFAKVLFEEVFGEPAPIVQSELRRLVIDKNVQYFRRYRPLNSFYYTGRRNRGYGYLDFLPAMRNFDVMVANRDQRLWAMAQGNSVPDIVDDSNVPSLPETRQSRGANRWMTPEEELASFKVDPRFEVNLFASEIEFPDLACPIQMRWDASGRLWVSCSTTYPHVYPGQEPRDKIIILEDTDLDGRADKSTVFADDLHIPLSFELGSGGVYVSDEPHMVFLKDADGDGRADFRRKLLTGFGTEDSHHALHDFVWTPDGDLMFREAIFHHSQVETPYGPVRARNSAWFQFQPDSQRLISFGNYPNTNPWGVTFDDWGYHVASHPVFASAFHSLNPPYPTQHPAARGIHAYSGVCGHEFVDFDFWPEELQGGFVKVRYKPSNRVEIHGWVEEEDHYREEYQGDLLFSSNLSFIPVDLRYGPRGAMYVCDWYNPVKGHMQYSLRDERRDRKSGRIWRIVPAGAKLQDPPAIAGRPIPELLDILKRSEYRYRYWAKRELREREHVEVAQALDRWVATLDESDVRYRHHQVEAMWVYQSVREVRPSLLGELLNSENRHARSAAVRELRQWHNQIPNAIELLRTAANDSNGLVRMEAANSASYIGTKAALDAALEITRQDMETHLAYALQCALGSADLRRHWENVLEYAHVPDLLSSLSKTSELKETVRSAREADFDTQKNLKTIRIAAVPERMKFSREQFEVTAGQPVKLIFTNPDATDHNLLIVVPGASAEVGMAANEMARDPKNATSDFVPPNKKALILQATKMIGPTRDSKIDVLRFIAPSEPGVYPYICTFPGHWVMMKGEMRVVSKTKSSGPP